MASPSRVRPEGALSLDELLAGGRFALVLSPGLATGESRPCGWYELDADPWLARWWTGTAWTGQPVAVSSSMVLSTFRSRG